MKKDERFTRLEDSDTDVAEHLRGVVKALGASKLSEIEMTSNPDEDFSLDEFSWADVTGAFDQFTIYLLSDGTDIIKEEIQDRGGSVTNYFRLVA